MSRWLIVVVSCLLLPCVARAQDELIKNFAPKHVETFIKEVMKTEATKQENPKEKVSLSQTPQGFFDVAFIGAPKKMVVFLYEYAERKISLEKANEWNSRRDLTRATIDKAEKLTLSAGFNFDAGLSQGQLAKYYEKILQEKKTFDEFTAPEKKGAKDAKDEKKKAEGPPVKEQPKKAAGVERVRQGFPADKADENDLTKSDTAWEIEWDFAPVGKQKVFRIVSAKFAWKDFKGKPRSLIVARNIQLVEAFTQYDDGKTCWLDIAKVGLNHVPGNEKFLGPACVDKGKLLESEIPGFNKKVYQELHYDGLRWISIYGDDPPAKKVEDYRARRGEKLILWSAIASGNYVYMMEYNFTDDGRIVCRLGFTAHNFFDRVKLPNRRTTYGFRLNDGDVHPHIGCWRLDFDLSDPVRNQGGPESNELKIVRRVFENGKFRQDARPFPGVGNMAAMEGKAKWVGKHFTTLRAESAVVKNTRGAPIAYDLVSTRTGTAEDLMPIHQAAGVKMDFVHYDFWVTRTPKDFKHYYQLPDFAKGQPLAGQGTTVWHSVPALHVPRDEDFGPGGVDAERGAALTEWIGFTLRPRNLFDGTPLYFSVKK